MVFITLICVQSLLSHKFDSNFSLDAVKLGCSALTAAAAVTQKLECRIVKMQVEQVRYITLSIKDKYIKDLKKNTKLKKEKEGKKDAERFLKIKKI